MTAPECPWSWWPQPDERQLDLLRVASNAAQHFLFGLAHGYVPTADGVFIYHGKGGWPMHFSHEVVSRPVFTESGGLRVGGAWTWSLDRVSWHKTSTVTFDGGELNGDFRVIVLFLEACPLVPLICKSALLRERLIRGHTALNRAVSADFQDAVQTMQPPFWFRCGGHVFTVHFHFLPPLHVTCMPHAWAIHPDTSATVPGGSVPEYAELVSDLNKGNFSNLWRFLLESETS